MTIQMVDGPPANLPKGVAAYAGYVDDSGIGVTYPTIVAEHPAAEHLSISTHGAAADMADVENGALTSWRGYMVGYASADNIGALILTEGRPKKLAVAHQNNVPHICTSAKCAPSSPIPWTADGTQWTNHGGLFDEWVLADDFFDFRTPPLEEAHMLAAVPVLNADGSTKEVLVYAIGGGDRAGQLLEFHRDPANASSNQVIDITDQIGGADPYIVQA